MYQFNINDRYTFDTIAPAILGQRFKNATLLGSMSYAMAKSYGHIDTLAASVKAYLPAGMSTDHTKYTYYSFTTEAGGNLLIAYPWIVESSIARANSQTLVVRVADSDINTGVKVRNVLAQAGFTVTDISLTDS